MRTSHGARTPSASESQHVAKSRYESTYEDGERAEEVADHGADRALVRADHERDRRADGDQHVGDARERELDRPLLHPEERRQLCVVHLRPEADEACAYKPRVVEVQPAGERM